MNNFLSNLLTDLDNFFAGHITPHGFIIFLFVIIALFILSYIHNSHSPYLGSELKPPKKNKKHS